MKLATLLVLRLRSKVTVSLPGRTDRSQRLGLSPKFNSKTMTEIKQQRGIKYGGIWTFSFSIYTTVLCTLQYSALQKSRTPELLHNTHAWTMYIQFIYITELGLLNVKNWGKRSEVKCTANQKWGACLTLPLYTRLGCKIWHAVAYFVLLTWSLVALFLLSFCIISSMYCLWHCALWVS